MFLVPIMLLFVVKAKRRVDQGDFVEAQSLGRASLIVSLCGFLIGGLVLIVVLATLFGGPRPYYYRYCYCRDYYGYMRYRDCRFCSYY